MKLNDDYNPGLFIETILISNIVFSEGISNSSDLPCYFNCILNCAILFIYLLAISFSKIPLVVNWFILHFQVSSLRGWKSMWLGLISMRVNFFRVFTNCPEQTLVSQVSNQNFHIVYKTLLKCTYVC